MHLYFFLKFFLIILYSPAFSIESNEETFEGNSTKIILAEKNNYSMDIGLEFSLEKDWKVYWIYPGEAGEPPNLNIINNNNYESLKPSWPFPEEEFDESIKLTSRIYKNNILIPYKVILKKNNSHIRNLEFKLQYQICKDICIPVTTSFMLEIPDENYKNKKNLDKINKYKKLSPVLLEENEKIVTSIKKITKNEILIKLRNNKIIDLKQDQVKAILYNPEFPTLRTTYINKNNNKIDIKLDSNEEIILNNNSSTIFLKIGDNVYFFKYIVKDLKNSFSKDIKSIFFIFITAFLAGFILNFMPCVLPVLGIKINNLLIQSSKRDKKYVKLSSLYVSLGIVSMFVFFSVLVQFFRSVGIKVGWGMQFQNPFFLMFLLLLLSIFTLITFDIMKINFIQKYFNFNYLNSLTNKNNLFLSNFSTGILSTLLATPCTAPLVGSAISFALSQSFFLSFLIFLLMGTGKALPYLIFIIKPSILLYLPKTGTWTKYLKFFIGSMLLISMLWLGKLLLNHYIDSYSINNNKEIKYNWEPFDKFKLSEYREDNKRVFLDITAEWCINCNVNKKLVLENDEVTDFFVRNNIILMRADWTFANESILNFLKEYEKFGIPFNIYYSEKYPKGYIFNEILTKESLLEVLDD